MPGMLPSTSTGMAPPCPRFVRRDPFAGHTSIFKPPVQQRFNLVVPTSLIERNFDMNTVLQRGLKVVFKRRSCDPSQPSEALAAVYGYVNRHVNPIGLTSYRVSGQQPAGVGSGCSLHGWSVEAGCLVVEVASRHQQLLQQHFGDVQDSTPAPARRLFGDCLPSPATIRKQRPQPEELPQQRLHHTMTHQEQDQGAQQLQQLEGSGIPPPEATVAILPPSAQVPATDANHSTGEPDAVGTSSRCQTQDSSSLQTSDFLSTTQGTAAPLPVAQKPSRGPQRAGKVVSKGHDTVATAVLDRRPKRHRRCPTWYNTDATEAKTTFAGIDLLLAAHMELTQQEDGRPKRVRRPNSLFMQ
ncbi:hypothetical protein VOLCADRAFT_88211 [Volvox carteri f. nagariensis]|uniref:Uncharacterized protein n=1 Tax=Volvox carteri f. nagariensis TaxID=3068 RepID=D8TNK6_VOLCA|nr:uncharacterized protein VOLCADRAFT_88211 [Volvox carteri f. nagariensis]EFJ51006.1 hypothetical protein VOLCADRAFT_88211 [Volvox carteri f. nagariensis]|eukprot:XP_002948018.1 hypothetical protein VOLCADRAFT_88211 [Volvox carteri f. nagariensis]